MLHGTFFFVVPIHFFRIYILVARRDPRASCLTVVSTYPYFGEGTVGVLRRAARISLHQIHHRSTINVPFRRVLTAGNELGTATFSLTGSNCLTHATFPA